MAIAINLIIAYLFLTITGGSEKNDGMVALYLTAGLVLLIIFMLLGTPLHIWSGPAFPWLKSNFACYKIKESCLQFHLAFGLAVNATGIEEFQFTGKPVDIITGLYYFGARFYDPAIGRFTPRIAMSDRPLTRWARTGTSTPGTTWSSSILLSTWFVIPLRRWRFNYGECHMSPYPRLQKRRQLFQYFMLPKLFASSKRMIFWGLKPFYYITNRKKLKSNLTEKGNLCYNTG